MSRTKLRRVAHPLAATDTLLSGFRAVLPLDEVVSAMWQVGPRRPAKSCASVCSTQTLRPRVAVLLEVAGEIEGGQRIGSRFSSIVAFFHPQQDRGILSTGIKVASLLGIPEKSILGLL